MKKLLIVGTIFITLLISACGRNVEYVKRHSQSIAKQANFIIVGYEGYQWDPYFGGTVYYLMKRKENDNIIYDGGFVYAPIAKEFNIYNIRAINAISPVGD